eukprot:TRINITY_DN850_c0_g1_i5.p1 TRINITY_DN850_c0_g1~~TRINITY_DN850_c0_g1_i5.p1  ORF type:complete len:1152 (+),score=324.05 TRINITY_DN850_c0_g1_i5:44-3499(+)
MGNGGFPDFWCGADPWGPWQTSSFTFCFDGLMVSSLRVAVLPLVVFRLVQAYRSPFVAQRNRSIKFVVQLACCALLAVAGLGGVVLSCVEHAPDQPPPYTLITNCLGIIAWTLAVFVVLEERRKFLPHNWILRGWWILELFVTTLQLPTVVTEGKERFVSVIWDGTLFTYTLAVECVLCFLLLFAQEAAYYKPAAPSAGPAAAAASVGAYSMLGSEEEELNDLRAYVATEQQDNNSGGSASALDMPPVVPERDPDDVNILSFISFSFLRRILNLRGSYKSRHNMSLDDISDLSTRDTAGLLSDRFQKLWNDEVESGTPKIARALRKMFLVQFLIAGLWRLVYDVLTFVPPLCLYWMINYASPKDATVPADERKYERPQWEGFVCAGLVLLSALMASVLQHVYYYQTYRIGQNVRSCIVTAVYRKCFALSNLALYNFPTGVIINHMSVDPMALLEVVPNLHNLWSAPLEIVVSLALLIWVIGWSALVGVAIIVMSIPLNAVCIRRMQVSKLAMMRHKDTRSKLLSEVLQAIKTVKLMVWERHLHGQLNAARHEEIRALLKVILWRSLMQFITWCLPMLVSLGTFTCYVLTSSHDLTTLNAFTSIALFNVIRFPMMKLPRVLSDIVQCVVALRRVTSFLCSSELDPKNVRELVEPPPTIDPAAPPAVVSMEDATFVWEDTGSPALSNVTFQAKRGQLIAVIGQVASGKSALLQAMLGFMKRVSGEVNIFGRVALATQHPWIQNMSFRDNILFGKPFNEKRYEAVVSACELQRDVTILSGGNTAEIGEEGSNLSGGQKQRLSLARAVYQDADIYLLDDTLSAVDANVGEAIFRNCFCDLLHDKTRIFVTQQFQYLSQVDYIFVLKEGTLVESGTYEHLSSIPDSEFSRLTSSYEAAMSHEHESRSPKPSEDEKKPSKPRADGVPSDLMSHEEQRKGTVPLAVYARYFREAGITVIVTALVCFVVSTFGNIFCNFWLSAWTQALVAGDSKFSDGEWLGIYAAIIVGTCVFLLFRFFILAKGTMNASENLHSKSIIRVLQSPMTFFHTTPLGRILNRFSEDMFAIDDKINFSLSMLLGTSLIVIGIIFTCCFVSAFYLCAIFPLVYLYLHTQEWYLVYARELVRLDAISRSPLYASFAETLHGLHTIRCFKQVPRY